MMWGLLIAAASLPAAAQSNDIDVPATVEAGAAFSIATSGSGSAVLYIVGPSQVLRRNIQLGDPLAFAAGDLDNAGHYLVVLTGPSGTDRAEFDVVPSSQPASLSFLARPSRLPVDIHNGITGAAYVFDLHRNLVTAPEPVTFQLSVPSGAMQTTTSETHDGAAWTAMDSAAKEGNAKLVAEVGGISATRIIQQVPGTPCELKMNAHKDGSRIDLETDPLRDCSGNPVTDGTIVTFTESWKGGETTVDVPLKHGIAQVEVPAYNGARISVATGVVMGNEIHWENR